LLVVAAIVSSSALVLAVALKVIPPIDVPGVAVAVTFPVAVVVVAKLAVEERLDIFGLSFVFRQLLNAAYEDSNRINTIKHSQLFTYFNSKNSFGLITC
jgi:hypothetical protein